MNSYTDRQQQIIQTSLSIAAEKGMHNLTIRNIAKSLHVTEPAVYRHFASKHEILVSMLDVLQSNIAPHFALLTKIDGTSDQMFTPFLKALFSTIEKNPSYALFIFSEEVFHSDEALRPLLHTLLERMLENLKTTCISLKEKGVCGTSLAAEDMALLIIATIRITVTRWHVGSSSTPLSTEVEHLNGLLKTLLCTQ